MIENSSGRGIRGSACDFGRDLRLSRRELLSTVAAVGLIAFEPAIFGVRSSAKADSSDSSDDEMPEPSSGFSSNDLENNDFSMEYSDIRNPFWISSLDLLSRDPLLDTPEPEDRDPYAVGRPVLMKNGSPIQDRFTKGLLTSPTSDVGPVVKAGELLGRCLSAADALSQAHHPLAGLAARIDILIIGLGITSAWGGMFDYQRTGFPGFFHQYPQYQHVSNFNIGVIAQQAKISETLVKIIAGTAAGIGSRTAHVGWSNWYNPISWNAPENREMIHLGYSLSAQGAFTQPHVP
jgi:hypothetical protein